MKKVKKNYNWLPDFVYGSIDGTITTFAVVAGVLGANLSVKIILILGFANLLGDGFSMAVGKYLSDKAQFDQLKKLGKDTSEVQPLKGSLYTFISFNLIGLIPLIGFIVSPLLHFNPQQTFIFASLTTLLALFFIGAVKAQFVKASKLYAGFQTMLIGGIAASIAYCVGYLMEKLVQ